MAERAKRRVELKMDLEEIQKLSEAKESGMEWKDAQWLCTAAPRTIHRYWKLLETETPEEIVQKREARSRVPKPRSAKRIYTILCVETGEMFQSQSLYAAAKRFDCSRCQLMRNLKGGYGGSKSKTTGLTYECVGVQELW